MKLELARWRAEIAMRPPHHFWLRFGVAWRYLDFEPGHAWLYEGLVRRDAWRIGGLCLYILRMPRA